MSKSNIFTIWKVTGTVWKVLNQSTNEEFQFTDLLVKAPVKYIGLPSGKGFSACEGKLTTYGEGRGVIESIQK